MSTNHMSHRIVHLFLVSSDIMAGKPTANLQLMWRLLEETFTPLRRPNEITKLLLLVSLVNFSSHLNFRWVIRRQRERDGGDWCWNVNTTSQQHQRCCRRQKNWCTFVFPIGLSVSNHCKNTELHKQNRVRFCWFWYLETFAAFKKEKLYISIWTRGRVENKGHHPILRNIFETVTFRANFRFNSCRVDLDFKLNNYFFYPGGCQSFMHHRSRFGNIVHCIWFWFYGFVYSLYVIMPIITGLLTIFM